MQSSVIMCTGAEHGDVDCRCPVRDAEAQKIIGAARLVLERSHFRSLKVRQVLAASNTSASNFYRRFPSKAHLLLALLEDEVRQAERRLRSEIDIGAPVADQLHTWLRINIGTAPGRARTQQTGSFLTQDLLEELPEQVRRLHRIIDNQLGEIIRRGMQSGELQPGDAEADAMLVAQFVRGLLSADRGGGLPCDENELVARVHGFVLRALGTAR